MFICVDLDHFSDKDAIQKKIADALEYMKTSEPVQDGVPVHFPGEHMKQVREENRKLGIPVDEGIWNQVLAM